MSVVGVRWIERAAEVRNANSFHPSKRKSQYYLQRGLSGSAPGSAKFGGMQRG